MSANRRYRLTLGSMLASGLVLSSIAGCLGKSPGQVPRATKPAAVADSSGDPKPAGNNQVPGGGLSAPAVRPYGAGESSDPSPKPALDYQSRVVSRGPFVKTTIPPPAWFQSGPPVAPAGPSSVHFGLLQAAPDCPPPLPEPSSWTIVENNGSYEEGRREWTIEAKYYFYYKYPFSGGGIFTYERWMHVDFSCVGGDCAEANERIATFWAPYYTDTGANPPYEMPPGSAGGVCSGTSPSTSPSPTIQPQLTVDHAAIGPGMDLGQDTTDVHVKAAQAWTLTISGGPLTGSPTVRTGTGTMDFNWAGTLADGAAVPTGNYTLTLEDATSGQHLQVPVTITRPAVLSIDGKASTAFSPNNDGPKDTARIEVRATGPWTIVVDGQAGVVKTGVEPNNGNKGFDWNGRVGGRKLPDGTYTLRLQQGSVTLATVTALIDEKKPSLEGLSLQAIDPSPGNKLAYTFNCKVRDLSQLSMSGIDKSGLRVEVQGVDVLSTEVVSLDAQGNCLLRATLPLPTTSMPRLNYTIFAKDMAGNSQKRSEFFELEIAYTGGKVVPAPPIIKGYQLMAGNGIVVQFAQALGAAGLALAGSPSSRPFFWNDGSRYVDFNVGIATQKVKNGAIPNYIPNIGVPIKVTIWSDGTTRSTPRTPKQVWYMVSERIPAVGLLARSIVRWNGRLNNKTDGEVAPSGKYHINVNYAYKEVTHEDCDCPPEFLPPDESGPLLYGTESQDFQVQEFSIINNDDHLTWGPATRGGEPEVLAAFRAFKEDVGGARVGFSWHHLVEKQERQFLVNQLNSTHNLVRIRQTLHTQLNYTRVERQALSLLPFTDQWDEGRRRALAVGWDYQRQEDF